MHLVYPPPQFCITVVSNFSWVLQLTSRKKSKTMVMQNFGGVNKVPYGLCETGELAQIQAYCAKEKSRVHLAMSHKLCIPD